MNRRLLFAVGALAALGCTDPAAPPDAATEDAATPDAGVDAGPDLVVVEVEDLGALPHPSDTVAGRDGASSGLIDGQLLWTFGDTFLYTPTPVDGSNVASATGPGPPSRRRSTSRSRSTPTASPASSSRTRTRSSRRTAPRPSTAGRSGPAP